MRARSCMQYYVAVSLWYMTPTRMSSNAASSYLVSGARPSRAIGFAVGVFALVAGDMRSHETFARWWVGDWLNYGEQRWGEMYAQAEVTTGWDYQRLRDAKWVANGVHLSVRKDNLSWSHHKEVAHLEPQEQAAWLNRAEVEGLSVRALLTSGKLAIYLRYT